MTVAKGAPECPVFRPTLADVTGLTFAEYVDKLEKSKAFREAGICKIVAPDGWAPRRQGYNRLNFELPRCCRGVEGGAGRPQATMRAACGGGGGHRRSRTLHASRPLR